MGDRQDYVALDWVKNELDETLKQARQALEAFVDDPQDSSQLRFCLNYLHQVRGTLQMVEFDGGALLAEELEALAAAFVQKDSVASEENLAILMQGILQLPTYTEKVLAGHQDLPIVLMPILNEIRSVRGANLLSETALFTPNLDSIQAKQHRAPLQQLSSPEAQQMLRKLRQFYQTALIGLLRNEDQAKNIDYLRKATAKLADLLEPTAAAELWHVLDALLISLQRKGLDFSVATKYLLRTADQYLRNILQQLANGSRLSINDELLKNALYYLAKSKVNDGLVAELKRRYRLDDALLSEERLLAERAQLSGPDQKTLESVVLAISEELTRIKERLDVMVRSGGATEPAQLSALLPAFKQISDTFAVLSLTNPRRVLDEQLRLVESLSQQETVDEGQLMDVAGGLLYVEATLNGLVEETARASSGALSQSSSSISGAQQAVLREARNGLEQSKDAIVAYISAQWDKSKISDIPLVLNQIAGSLSIIPLTFASQIVSATREYIEYLLKEQSTEPDFAQMDSLADALMGVEYYIERISLDPQSTPTDLLDRAAKSLDMLGFGVKSSAPERDNLAPQEEELVDLSAPLELATVDSIEVEQRDISAEVPESVEDIAEVEEESNAVDLVSMPDQDSEFVQGTDEIDQDTDTSSPADVAPESEEGLVTSTTSEAADDEDSLIDDEILEIFIEEAEEVQETIAQYFPVFRANPDDSEALTEVRRAFHTLKGSGRMVEAGIIGELAWSIENMLNRLIDGTISLSDDLFDVTEQVYLLVPDLIDDFKHLRREKPMLVDYLERKAWALSKGEAFSEAPPETESALSELIEQDLSSAEVLDVADLEEVQDAASELADEDAVLDEDFSGEFAEPSLEDALEDDEIEQTLDGTEEFDQALLSSDEDILDQQSDSDELPMAEAIWAEDDDELSAELDAELLPGELDDFESSAFLLDEVEEELEVPAPVVAADEDEDEILVDADESQDSLASESLDSDLLEPVAGWDAESLDSDLGFAEEADSFAVDPQDVGQSPLLVIFREEVVNHLERIAELIEESKREQGVKDEMQHALHTIRGSAEMAGVDAMAELVRPLELLVKDAIALAVNLDQELEELLYDGVDKIGECLSELDGATVKGIDRDFLDRIYDCRRHLGPDAANSIEEPELGLLSLLQHEAVDRIMQAEEELDKWRQADISLDLAEALQHSLMSLAQSAKDLDLIPMQGLSKGLADLVLPLAEGLLSADQTNACAQAISELVDMFDRLAAGQSIQASPDLLSALGVSLPTTRVGTARSTVAEAVSQPEVAEAEVLVDEVEEFFDLSSRDEDLIAIFLEEADELLESVQASFERWTRDGESNDLAVLQRDLHTLKGGARMAEIGPIGDLAHELEFLYEGLLDGRFDAPENVGLVCQAAHDMLSDMVHQVANEHRTKVPRALIQSIADVRQGKTPNKAEATTAGVSAKTSLELVDLLAADQELDDDILEVFLDEAQELLNELDQSINGWRQEPNNELNADEMKRVLHTLKGGARLAKLSGLGTMSHDFESFIIKAQQQRRPLDDTFFDEILRFYDEISAAIDLLQSYMEGGLGQNAAAKVDLEDTVETDDVSTNVVPFQTPKAASDEDNLPVVSQKPAKEAVKTELKDQADPMQLRRTKPQETVKVAANLLEGLVNLAGETSISRSRLEQEVSDFGYTLNELDATVDRLREQIRRLDMETEAQVIFRQEKAEESNYQDFDPLEMDRYSQIQQLSRSMLESASDLFDLKDTLENRVRDAETILLQQSRINTELQEGLMRTRMVPFSRLVPRLRRIVRQVATELNKDVAFEVYNAEGELDRTVLERIVSPLEHMLRNAVDHGLETPEQRVAAGKNPQGRISLSISREGGDVVLRLSDDGQGINVEAVRQKAIARGLMDKHSEISDQDALRFIFDAGFSTAETVTQISGRGVGLDVVNSEVRQLGGRMNLQSNQGEGTTFVISLPFTVSVNRALMINLGEDFYAIPLSTIEGVVRIHPQQLTQYFQPDAPTYDYAGKQYKVQYLGNLLGAGHAMQWLDEQTKPVPVILSKSTEQGGSMAFFVDSLQGSREIVVKTLGPQFAKVPGVSGATILGDGSVVIILDMSAMIRYDLALDAPPVVERLGVDQPEDAATSGEVDASDEDLAVVAQAEPAKAAVAPVSRDRYEERPLQVMVVDDSVTVRKVTTRLLERNGMEVLTAKDGADAVAQLQEHLPDVMLLDIEMPRMDGFEVANHIRHSQRLKNLPIIMITSRTGQKHKDRALQIGVNEYLGKPFQEGPLLETIARLTQHVLD